MQHAFGEIKKGYKAMRSKIKTPKENDEYLQPSPLPPHTLSTLSRCDPP
jgi:hypothetical protein